MKNRFLGCLILFVIGAGLVVGAYFAGNAFGRKYSAEITPLRSEGLKPSIPPVTEKEGSVPGSGKNIDLYVPDEKQGENAVKKAESVPAGDLLTDKLTRSMELLTEKLVKDGVLPEGTRLVGRVRVKGGVAFVDFSEDIKKFSGSTLEEAQLANSLACTAAANDSSVKTVQLLVQGSKIETLGGHLDFSEPFGPDMQ
ncbi:MAG: GerMN domain-containing protein [Abditibacteriota bacterium]|nr:GerMN domain-containing protein [Abditibacteriota bacterium]